MTQIKYELQSIIIGNGPDGESSDLKKVQSFLRRNAETSSKSEKQKHLKSEEESYLIDFASKENLIYAGKVSESSFISEGAEQRVYRLDDYTVIKVNSRIFYESWLDYFNSLLIHNYFFKSTAYEFLGFKLIDNSLFAVVKQNFIVATENTDLKLLKNFLEFNEFSHVRNNDYINKTLGIIFEDLHDENVLISDGLLYFIDTVIYLTQSFYSNN